jgi:hypothetical protein
MNSYEAIQRAIAGKTVLQAKELHLSTSTVNKWQEPTSDYTDSGAFNPLDRVEKIIETSLKLQISREDALAPIQFLASRFNCVLIPLPETSSTLKNLQSQLSHTVKEFSHLMESSADAMVDNIITADERRRIEREGQHLMHHLGCYLEMVKEASER